MPRIDMDREIAVPIAEELLKKLMQKILHPPDPNAWKVSGSIFHLNYVCLNEQNNKYTCLLFDHREYHHIAKEAICSLSNDVV